MMSTSTIHSLNDDCLESLFTQFTILEWIIVLRRVCPRWNALIDRMHHTAFLNKSPNDSDSPTHADNTKTEVYLFKRIHFAISFNFKVQRSESFLQGILQSFSNMSKECNPLAEYDCSAGDDYEVFHKMIANKLGPIEEVFDSYNGWYDSDFKMSKLRSIHVWLYHESNPMAIQRLELINSLNALLSVAVFWKMSINNEDIKKKILTALLDIVRHVMKFFDINFPPFSNCHFRQIDSLDSVPFESLKLYREFGSFTDSTNTKKNWIPLQITELVHRMRPESLSEKFENNHNFSIQTCNRMYKLKLSLCMPSSSVAAVLLRNYPRLHSLNLKFQNKDLFKFDQTIWKAIFGLSQLAKLRIAFASIDLSILEKVSLVSHSVHALTLERVEIVIQPADKIEGQRDAELVARTLLRVFPDVQHVALAFTDQHLTVITGYYLRQLKPDVEIE